MIHRSQLLVPDSLKIGPILTLLYILAGIFILSDTEYFWIIYVATNAVLVHKSETANSRRSAIHGRCSSPISEVSENL